MSDGSSNELITIDHAALVSGNEAQGMQVDTELLITPGQRRSFDNAANFLVIGRAGLSASPEGDRKSMIRYLTGLNELPKDQSIKVRLIEITPENTKLYETLKTHGARWRVEMLSAASGEKSEIDVEPKVVSTFASDASYKLFRNMLKQPPAESSSRIPQLSPRVP